VTKKKVKKIAKKQANTQIDARLPWGTGDIADGAVTGEKIADNAVNGAKIEDDSIGRAELGPVVGPRGRPTSVCQQIQPGS
jgi:hypothetical protein